MARKAATQEQMQPIIPPVRGAYPLALTLPHGRALLEPGSAESGEPRYRYADGAIADVSVVIPPDLLADGWFWWGASLKQQKGGPDKCIIGIMEMPPKCFDIARRISAQQREQEQSIRKVNTRKAGKKAQQKVQSRTRDEQRQLTFIEVWEAAE